MPLAWGLTCVAQRFLLQIGYDSPAGTHDSEEHHTAQRFSVVTTIKNGMDVGMDDQLISRWASARETLTRLLAQRYEALLTTGWRVSRGDIRADVQRLLGGAYLEFRAKRL